MNSEILDKTKLSWFRTCSISSDLLIHYHKLHWPAVYLSLFSSSCALSCKITKIFKNQRANNPHKFKIRIHFGDPTKVLPIVWGQLITTLEPTQSPPQPAPKVSNLVKKLEICQPGNFALHPQTRVGDGRRFLQRDPFLDNNPQVQARAERELRRLNWVQEASPIVSLEDMPKFNLLPSETAPSLHSRTFLSLPSPRV